VCSEGVSVSLNFVRARIYGKVAIVLKELGFPHEMKKIGDGFRQKPFTDINPNCRVPTV